MKLLHFDLRFIALIFLKSYTKGKLISEIRFEKATLLSFIEWGYFSQFELRSCKDGFTSNLLNRTCSKLGSHLILSQYLIILSRL